MSLTLVWFDLLSTFATEKGFDWLVATLFLILSSASDSDDVSNKTLQHLERFSSLLCSVYNWKYHPQNTKVYNTY